MTEHLINYWHVIAGLMMFATQILATGHVVFKKRDTGSTISWVGFIWLVPLFGVVLYFLFGINRIRRRGDAIRHVRVGIEVNPREKHCEFEFSKLFPSEKNHMVCLEKIVHHITQKKLLCGNRIRCLQNGDEAFPVMIDAIDHARHSISICSYLFNNDHIGKHFVDRMFAAIQRGVKVCVLLDAVGAQYSFPSIVRKLRKMKVSYGRFLPTLIPGHIAYMNMRNHRKIMVVDGKQGFSGGMNIHSRNLLNENPKEPVKDLHFMIEGPVVSHLQEIFAEDWAFTKGEVLKGDLWFPELEDQGPTLARGISDGPDEDFDNLNFTLRGAFQTAKKSIWILTPYFVPDQSLIMAMIVCAMRGVEINLILPEKNNLNLVKWASMSLLWQLIGEGVKVWLSPPPFDHSKIMVVDDSWVLLGSGNWDMRSLRLNFEFNVECYDPLFADEMITIIAKKMTYAKPITLSSLRNRNFFIKLRDNTARLFSPYI